MNKYFIFFILLMTIFSCENDINFDEKLHELYAGDTVTINSLEVKAIFASKNRVSKIKNLFLISSLFKEEELILNNEKSKISTSCNSKLDENLKMLSENKREHRKTITDLNEEIERLNVKTEKYNTKYYVLFYEKDHRSKYSIIMDSSLNVIYAQDPLLN